ncbi:MAG: hypothetical protein L0229_22355 [Blastocatellia bacterium]|nr:hypothetical protein [Blastocatellia bacterium]
MKLLKVRKYLALFIISIFVCAVILAVINLRQSKTTDPVSNPANPVSEEVGAKTTPDDDDSFKEEGLPAHTGRYDNYVYYFSLVIPRGLIGYSAPEPAPAHGVAILLSKKPDTWIYAGAHYNATFLESLDAALDQHLEWIKDKGTDIEVMKRERTFLNKLRAMRLAVRYKNKKTGRIRIEDEVIAFRPGGTANADIIYNITLYTTDDRYNDDITTFEHILKGWKLKRIPRL